ncbi:putative DNA-binding domain-containing protein [Hydrogenophaga sp. RWCD_12]|uniref:HvfC/BufC family peptide modification chaperone n=1 Tax=Hydrogenophaga sp. RWCD_12 TaxID=3391190 RepID=UPI003984E35F
MNPPTTLASAQRALLDTLFALPASPLAHEAPVRLSSLIDDRHAQSARGLLAYRANGHALAERALLAAYPVVCAVLGDESFSMLARALWHRHPPQRGDIALWGDDLPAFVQDDPQLAGLPWLADVARVEWALHRAATADDAWADPASFALLQQPDPAGLTLQLAPGVCVVQSHWPVASIVNAHIDGAPTLDEAWRRCREPEGEIALVWRAGLRPRVAAIAPPAGTLLRLLVAGADLPHALDGACEVADGLGAPFDFSAWLGAAVTDGVVLGAAHLPMPTRQETGETP